MNGVNVGCETTLLGKIIATWLAPCLTANAVGAQVVARGVAVRVNVVTHFTLLRLLPTVRMPVVVWPGTLSERLLTLATLVRPLTAVHSLVSPECRVVLEGLATVLAAVWPGVLLH